MIRKQLCRCVGAVAFGFGIMLAEAEAVRAQEETNAPLSLTDVLGQVERNYPRILGAEADRQAATARRVSRQGAFDLNLVSGSDFQRYNSTSTRGKEVTQTLTDAGAELLFRSGISVYAGARLNVGAVKAPDSQTGTNGEIVVGVRVPILRGFGTNPRAIAEQQALLGEPLADAQFRRTRLDALRDAGAAYWNWVAAGQKLSVARELLRVAEIRATAIATRAELGDLPGVDAIEAAQQVAARQGLLVAAERDFQRAAFRLALFQWQPDGSPAPAPPESEVPQPNILPEPQPVDDATQITARDAALAARPEVPVNILQRQIAQTDRDLAQNDTQPNLNLLLQPGSDNGRKSVGDTLKFGLQFSVPLQRREATGRRDEADLRLQRIAQEATLLRRQITLEVDDAVSAVNRAYERYNTTVRERDLAIQLQSKERDRLRLGEGTLFLLNQRERLAAEAAQKVIDARADYFSAVLALQVAAAQL